MLAFAGVLGSRIFHALLIGERTMQLGPGEVIVFLRVQIEPWWMQIGVKRGSSMPSGHALRSCSARVASTSAGTMRRT